MAEKLKIGALGNSKMLRRFIQSPEISSLATIDVIATRSEDSALIARKKYPDRIICNSYEAAIEMKDLDAIYICLPTGLHFSWAKKAIEAGKSVLIEKPAVLESQDAIILDGLAKAKQVLLMESWWYRFHPLVESLRKLISSGCLGNIRHISSSFSYVNPDVNDSRWQAELGGGALYDMFSYHVDFLNYVLGIRNQNIELVQAFARYQHGVDACISSELITDNGAVCHFAAGLDRPSLCKTFIIGEAGTVEIPHLRILPEFGESRYILYKNGEPQIISFEVADAYALMFNQFASACLYGEPSPIPFLDTINNTQLLERIKTARDEN